MRHNLDTGPPGIAAYLAVVRASIASGPHADPAGLLRNAFSRYAESARWRWEVLVYPVPGSQRVQRAGTPTAVRVDLTREDAAVLAALLEDAAEPGEGRPARGPIGAWIGTQDVAARIGVQPSTIRGWIARREPKAHPLPVPDGSYRGRNYWQKSTIDAWKTEREHINARRRSTSGRPSTGSAGS